MFHLPAGVIESDLPSVTNFITSTDHVVKSKFTILKFAKSTTNKLKKRGRIEMVDDSLGVWHTNKNSGSSVVQEALYGVIRACQHWLKEKKNSQKISTAARTLVVTNLRDLAWRNLKLLNPRLAKMEDRKQLGGFGALKSMSGVYQHERTFYLKSGKKETASASIMHSGDIHPQGKDFSQLTMVEYENLVQQYKSVNTKLDMVYLNKLNRSQHFVTIDPPDGLLYNGKDEKIDSNFLEPYAMDQYGNLFSMLFDKNLQINHSSFLGGKDAICAGCIGVRDGQLLSIDNNSGHYKPGVENLVNAIRMLAAQSAITEDTVAGIKLADGSMPFYNAFELALLMDPMQYATLVQQPDPKFR
jgi:hypothetical protein